MKSFTLPIVVTLLVLMWAFVWGGAEGLFICALLVVMEVSFSFDNAVVNATVLKDMDELWRKRFLTWGMMLMVCGMYYLFPLAVVAFATGMGLIDVMYLAFKEPEAYARHLMVAHVQIACFGGMFLLMVVLGFLFNEHKERHWFLRLERRLAQLGKLEAIEATIALCVLLVLQAFLPQPMRLGAITAGVIGVVLYVIVHSIAALLGSHDGGKVAYRGLSGFLYLNLLDASLSMDAVIGSFAISRDIVIIMLGLSAGAMFVRSLTLHMVRHGTLEQYVYLEHGAYYGIGALALLLLVSLFLPVPEVVSGLVGIMFIGLSIFSSVKYNRLNGENR